MATVTLPTGVARIGAAGDDLLVPCLIFGIPEDAALHPVGSFGVATARILPLFGLEVTEMFKNEHACSMLGSELNNAHTHQMGHVLITMAYRCPEGGIVLLVFCYDASLRSVTCNATKLALPKARYLSAPANEAGGEDGAFDSLDGTHGDLFAQIEIDGADLCLGAGNLFCYFRWRAESLLDRGVQPPLLAMPDELGAAQLKAFGQIAGQGAHLDPGPARSSPDFERDRVLATVLPLSGVEGSRLVPGARRDWRALCEGLLLPTAGRFRFVPLFARPPARKRGEEGAGRAEGCIDGGPAEHGRDIWGKSHQRHDRSGVRFRRVGESFQGRECLLVLEREDTFMGLDDFKVEGDDTIKEGGILRKAVGMLRLVVQCRSDRAGRLSHVCFLLVPCATSVAQYSTARTCFQQARAKARTRLTTGSNRVACGGLKPLPVRSSILKG